MCGQRRSDLQLSDGSLPQTAGAAETSLILQRSVREPVWAQKLKRLEEISQPETN